MHANTQPLPWGEDAITLAVEVLRVLADPTRLQIAGHLLADEKSVLVPRPMVLLELADLLSQSKPTEASAIYQQIKKEYPGSTISERADRGLDLLAPKS